MKRSFVYLVLALALSLLLCGCGNMNNDGLVTSSPWPDVTNPVLPTPNPMVSATPIPEIMPGSSTNANSPDTPAGTTAPNMSSASPRPTDSGR